MKLTVKIERFGRWNLEAYVVQGDRRGRNLLTGRRIAHVETARFEAQKTLQRELGCAVQITWTGESPESDRMNLNEKWRAQEERSAKG